MKSTDLRELSTVALPAVANHIGRDREGHDHYLVPGDRVFVIDHDTKSDQLIHEQLLEEGELTTWVDFVADRRGWICCKVDERPMAEWLFTKRVPREAGR